MEKARKLTDLWDKRHSVFVARSTSELLKTVRLWAASILENAVKRINDFRAASFTPFWAVKTRRK